VCKTEIDGDPTQLFFRQAIGIGAGQRLDQSALAVIHVPCRSENKMSSGGHLVQRHTARIAEINSSSCPGNMVRKSSRKLPRAT
jgi:predicted DNA-binding protein with PD1-like motif